jgi:hypothetical protein
MNIFNKIPKYAYFVIIVFSYFMVQQFIDVAVKSKEYAGYNTIFEKIIVIGFCIIGVLATHQFFWKKEGKKK